MELSSARSIIGELSWRNIYLVTQKYTGGGRRTRFIGSLWRKRFRRTKLFRRKNRFSSGEEIYRNRYRTRPWNFLVFLESLRIECRNGGQWSLTIIFTFYRDLRSVEDRSRITFCLGLRWFEDRRRKILVLFVLRNRSEF